MYILSFEYEHDEKHGPIVIYQRTAAIEIIWRDPSVDVYPVVGSLVDISLFTTRVTKMGSRQTGIYYLAAIYPEHARIYKHSAANSIAYWNHLTDPKAAIKLLKWQAPKAIREWEYRVHKWDVFDND